MVITDPAAMMVPFVESSPTHDQSPAPHIIFNHHLGQTDWLVVEELKPVLLAVALAVDLDTRGNTYVYTNLDFPYRVEENGRVDAHIVPGADTLGGVEPHMAADVQIVLASAKSHGSAT